METDTNTAEIPATVAPVNPKTYTDFGKYLAFAAVSFADAARDLGITRSYASMLSSGRATPGLKLAYIIQEWARLKDGDESHVTMESWIPFLPPPAEETPATPEPTAPLAA